MGFVEDHLAGLAATVALESERTREALAAGLAQTIRGQRITGARPVSLPGPVGSRVLTNATGGRLVGWSVFAGAGPVRLIFHDGRDASGDVIAVRDLVDQEDDTVSLAPGIFFADGLFLEVTGTGTNLLGAVHIGVVD